MTKQSLIEHCLAQCYDTLDSLLMEAEHSAERLMGSIPSPHPAYREKTYLRSLQYRIEDTERQIEEHRATLASLHSSTQKP